MTAEGARSLKCISKCETSLHFFHLSGCTLQHHHHDFDTVADDKIDQIDQCVVTGVVDRSTLMIMMMILMVILMLMMMVVFYGDDDGNVNIDIDQLD